MNKNKELFKGLVALYLLLTTIHALHCDASLGEYCQNPFNKNEPCKRCPPCNTRLDLKIKQMRSSLCGDLTCYPCKRVTKNSRPKIIQQLPVHRGLNNQTIPCTDRINKGCKDQAVTGYISYENLSLLQMMMLGVVCVAFVITIMQYVNYRKVRRIGGHKTQISSVEDVEMGFVHTFRASLNGFRRSETTTIDNEAAEENYFKLGKTIPQPDTLDNCKDMHPLMEESSN